MKEWFCDWFDSAYYHLLYQNRDQQEAALFVENLARQYPPVPGATLLDLACGKGRHSIALASMGYDVCGLDLSPESIAWASQSEHASLHFFRHDMRHVFRVNYFDMVVNLFTSFGYFCNDHDHTLAAKAIALGLKPGGRFIIDFINREPARAFIRSQSDEKLERNFIQFHITRRYTETHFIKHIEVLDQQKVFQFEEKVRSFTPDELITLFSRYGLKQEHLFGDYHFSPYVQDESPRMIITFTKPHV